MCWARAGRRGGGEGRGRADGSCLVLCALRPRAGTTARRLFGLFQLFPALFQPGRWTWVQPLTAHPCSDRSKAPAAVGRAGGSSSAGARLNLLLLRCPRTGLWQGRTWQGRIISLTSASSARHCMGQALWQHQRVCKGEWRGNII